MSRDRNAPKTLQTTTFSSVWNISPHLALCKIRYVETPGFAGLTHLEVVLPLGFTESGGQKWPLFDPLVSVTHEFQTTSRCVSPAWICGVSTTNCGILWNGFQPQQVRNVISRSVCAERSLAPRSVRVVDLGAPARTDHGAIPRCRDGDSASDRSSPSQPAGRIRDQF